MEDVIIACLFISSFLHSYIAYKIVKLEKRIDLLENKRLKGD